MPRRDPDARRSNGGREVATRAPLPPGFGIIWTTVALDLVGFGIVLPVLPLYAKRFHASAGMAGALVAAFSLAQLVGSPMWGRLSDRVGRKPVLIVSLFGTAAGSLLTGLAGGLPLLFLGRLVDGGSGASVSVAQATVADLAAPEQRARLFGLLGAAFGLGFVLGPAIGGALSPISPRLPFYVAAAIAAVNGLAAIRRLPETGGRRHGGATEVPDLSAEARTVPAAPTGRVALLGVAFLSLVAFSGFEATFALFGARRLGLHQSSTYVVFTVIGVLIALDQVALVHPVVRRVGDRFALQIGLLLNGAGLALLPFVHSLWALAPSLLLLTAGQGLITPTLTATVTAHAGPEERGRVLGLQQSAGGLARVVGPAVAGLAFGHIGPWAPYAGGAVVIGLAAIALAAAPRAAPAPEARRVMTPIG